MTIEHIHIITTPVGSLTIIGNDHAINTLTFKEGRVPTQEPLSDIMLQCVEEINAYFAGSLQGFNFPVAQPGTEFQQTVWQQLKDIPYGQTISYLQLAKRINNPKSIRAVGTTNGKNRIAIVVPCHRVIGSDGSLTGYAGGLWRKKWLLEHEIKQKFGSLELF
ncbi:methylated-DNA--[protein]-cysteine S-methyltransferase [Chitinophaga pinensis]|uniref:Methylated-DNA--protein-cysteine methyltransferase n=1 Tax=Chitinophaga pinensis (strain ATCC 43595 / DSM 2588 / LMG 13176 / NBRC 15968 / NCIMB 11800 / UQM 2034) TaxID=485918 RepID=A0A979G4F0_CHIPD|nr:methylated-DNA--[protein]-cysteine S-methyltransferase [Chitinophaga pinensis]ACU60403.1 methylated-DNA/protein-cysteinemethyltransferase [Chitinophaga pinensis DSM 2588]